MSDAVYGPAPRYEQLASGDERDAWPMWSNDGKTVYYMSDRGGTMNIWARGLGSGQPRQLTTFTTGRVLWPTISYDGKTIVFERDFHIWSLDVASGKAAQVPITLRGASASNADEHLSLTTGFGSLALSPDGKKIAFTARGDVFAASAKDGGDAVRVTTRELPDGHGPDGASAAASDPASTGPWRGTRRGSSSPARRPA